MRQTIIWAALLLAPGCQYFGSSVSDSARYTAQNVVQDWANDANSYPTKSDIQEYRAANTARILAGQH